MNNDEGKCAGGVEITTGPCPKCGAGDDDVCPTEAANELHHSSVETEALYEMLDCYWGKGDGAEPPEFIQRAAKLCGYQLADLAT